MPDSQVDEQRIRNLEIRQTTLDDKVSQVQAQFGYNRPSDAFQALIVSLLFDVDYDAIEPSEIVDGGHDKQIDIIRIEEDQERKLANIHIIQAKSTGGFGSNTIIQMRNGLSWIFSQPTAEVAKLNNPSFVAKVGEIRGLRTKYSPANLSVFVYYVTPGDTRALPDQYIAEKKILIDQFSNVGFSRFEFKELGGYELYDMLIVSEGARKVVDTTIPIIYDVNRASLIEYSFGGTRAVICTVTGIAIAELASTEQRDAIFDLNVRPYYGNRGKVNLDIENTCKDPDESGLFWFLNNGLTLVCDQYSVNYDPDVPTIKLNNVQIVNGCQTTVTLREAWERGELQNDVKVLVRIYATADSTLTERVTLTTNNQNRITDRDLRANDDVQRDIQRSMKDQYGYFYERKNKEYRLAPNVNRKRIVANYKAGQAYLAIVGKKPSVARGYLAKIWDDHYKEIFANATVEDLLGAYLIYDYCSAKASAARPDKNMSDLEREVAVYGVFHLAQLVGYYLTNGKWGSNSRSTIGDLIAKLEILDTSLLDAYGRAMKQLVTIRRTSLQTSPNPALYFKANDVQVKINRAIYGASKRPS